MKKRSWLTYLILIIVLLVSVIIKRFISSYAEADFRRTFNFNIFFVYIIPLVLNILIGMLLGTEYILREMKKAGGWKVNYLRLIIMGLPAAYLSSAYLIYLIPYIYPRKFFFFCNSDSITVFQIILGYLIITGFYKSDHINNSGI